MYRRWPGEEIHTAGGAFLPVRERYVPDFQITKISGKNIGDPITVKWSEPEWPIDPNLKPDFYNVYFYNQNGLVFNAERVHETEYTLEGTYVSLYGIHTIEIYACMFDSWGDVSGYTVGKYNVGEPEVKITYPNQNNHSYLVDDSIEVKGYVIGGLDGVYVQLVNNEEDIDKFVVSLENSIDNRVKVYCNTDGEFTTILNPADNLTPSNNYKIVVTGFFNNIENSEFGKDEVFITVESTKPEKFYVTLSEESREYTNYVSVFAKRTRVTPHVRGNNSLNRVKLFVDHVQRGDELGEFHRLPDNNWVKQFDFEGLSFSEQGKHTLRVETQDGIWSENTINVYVVDPVTSHTRFYSDKTGSLGLKKTPDSKGYSEIPEYGDPLKIVGEYGNYYYVYYYGSARYISRDAVDNKINLIVFSPSADITDWQETGINLKWDPYPRAKEYEVNISGLLVTNDSEKYGEHQFDRKIKLTNDKGTDILTGQTTNGFLFVNNVSEDVIDDPSIGGRTSWIEYSVTPDIIKGWMGNDESLYYHDWQMSVSVRAIQ